MLIRDATAEDIPDIIALAEDTWRPTYVPIIGEMQVRYMLDKFYSPAAVLAQMKDGQHFLLMLENEEPVGFASYSKNDGGTYKLNKLYVQTNIQGRGLGKALLGAVMRQVKDLGAEELILNVNRHNPAKAFYEREGFVVLREEDIDIGEGYFMNDFVMGVKFLRKLADTIT